MKFLLIAVFCVMVGLYIYATKNSQKDLQAQVDAGAQFLAENRDKPGIEETASGLQYEVIEQGSGSQSPSASDKVLVHYHGQLITGQVFDSSVDRGQPISFGLNQVISGWTEGLQLMKEGDKFRFFIPSNLAYGNRSAGTIPAGSVLIFEVELIEVK